MGFLWEYLKIGVPQALYFSTKTEGLGASMGRYN